MDRHLTIRRLVATVLIAGLALAPLSKPVMADSLPGSAMAAMSQDMAASVTTDEMANDMPCRPSKAPASTGCEKCLLMAVCMTASFAAVPASTLLRFPAVSSRIARPKDNSWLQSLVHPPPDHPPRLLV